MRVRALLTVAALAASVLLIPASAHAAARVSVGNDQGSATADPTYATTLKVRGSGFQSIKGGHGGIYVVFGTRVSGGYLYVPDSETKGNQGFQRFVAFPGSDTADSANGGTISAGGTWTTSLVVPGSTFRAVDRNGKAQTIDCLKVTCGVITIGAHGVKNARNETFTPVKFEALQARDTPTPRPSSSSVPAPTPTSAPVPAATSDAAPAAPDPGTAPAPAPAVASLTVERSTAVAGRVMSFTAVGLTPGDQVVASLDDGAAAVGPINVGPNGQVAGVVQLPSGLSPGTHRLTLTGGASSPTVNFPVAAGDVKKAAATAPTDTPWLPISFAGLALVALIGALVFSVVTLRATRRRSASRAA